MIGISIGDPAGIGPEVLTKAIKELYPVLKDRCIIFSDRLIFKHWERELNFNMKQCIFVPLRLKAQYPYGKPTSISAKIAWISFVKALEYIERGEISSLLTMPLSKESMREFYPEFTGHTGYLSTHFKRTTSMILHTSFIDTLLLTEHIPLKDVSSRLEHGNNSEKIELFLRFLIVQGKKKPRIALLNINPHGKESYEKESIVINLISRLREAGIDIEGPVMSDSVMNSIFMYNGLIATYHDQAMILIRMLNGGINVTYGLDFLRVSPLHGTGYDIAGMGIANPSSTINSLNFLLNYEK